MIILNKKNEIFLKIAELADWCDRVDIGVAFITDSGIDIINPLLEGKDVRVITTTHDFITGPKALWFMNANYDLKLIDGGPRVFHSKTLDFYKGKKKITIVGSLNLTKPALFNKFETVNVIKDNEEDSGFNYLWDKEAKSIDDNFIDDYELKFNAQRIKKKELNDMFEKHDFKIYDAEPRGMQIKVLEELNDLRNEGEEKALLWAATGTGKTFTAAFDAQVRDFKKLLFIVHNRTIIKSAKRDFDDVFQYKTSAELFTNNIDIALQNDIVFSTEKTIKSILGKDNEFLNQFDYFVFDEVHKLGKDNFQDDIFKLVENVEKKFILGMTATPKRTDNKNFVIKKFRNIVGKIDTEMAIENKYISPFKYYAAEVDVDYDDDKDLKDNDIELMVEKFMQKLSSIKTWDRTKVKGLVFTKTTTEADAICELLNEKGINSVAIHSKKNSSTEFINTAISNLQDDHNILNIIVTVNKFNEGVDIPRVNTIGMFRFTESSIIYTQQIGRGLRNEENDDKFLNIIDLVGNFTSQDKNVNRLDGLWGGKLRSPKEILTDLVEGKTFGNVEFDINNLAMRKILKSIDTLSFSKYFDEKMSDSYDLYDEKVDLNTIEDVLEEDVGIIINTLKSSKTISKGTAAWYLTMPAFRERKIKLSNDENIILELFTWLPLTCSTPIEKKQILELLKGEEQKLPAKWISYFVGRSYYDNKLTQLVKHDNSKYFERDQKNGITFLRGKCSNKLLAILDDVISYLTLNSERNDKLEIGKWYSKAEVGFMAGYTSSVSKGKFGFFKGDEDYDVETNFITNIIQPKETSRYRNEILDENKFILCSSDTSEISPKKTHNFIGKDLFNRSNRTMYKYVGTPLEMALHDISTTWKTDKNYEIDGEKQYSRYMISPKVPLSREEFIYLNHF